MPENSARLAIPRPLGSENVTRANYRAALDAIDENAAALGLNAQAVNKMKALNIDIAGREVTLAYDGSDRLQTITDKDGETTVDTMNLAYDGNGNLQTITEVAGGSTITTTLGYTAGKLTSITPVVT